MHPQEHSKYALPLASEEAKVALSLAQLLLTVCGSIETEDRLQGSISG